MILHIYLAIMSAWFTINFLRGLGKLLLEKLGYKVR